MGWFGEYREKGQSDDEFFRGEFDEDTTILASACMGDAWYAAVRHKDKAAVTAQVIIFKSSPRYPDYFMYKPLDETMFPCEVHAPAEILDLLTPTDNEDANDWRAACRANVAETAQFLKGTG